MDKEAAQNLFNQVHTLWVEPEIEKRRQEGRLSHDFKISKCLILLPQDQTPIVSFNEEISWTAKAVPASKEEFTPNSDAYLHDIQRIEHVEPPTVDGVRAAFVFLFWRGYDWSIICDFSPNWPSEEASAESDEAWVYGSVIAEYLQDILREKAVRFFEQNQPQLNQIGLWVAPALLPYPISEITNRVNQGDLTGAKGVLVSHCNPDYLEALISRWWDAKPFGDRRRLLEDALQCHREGRFGVCIYSIVPQIEGIVADWVSSHLPPGDSMPDKQGGRTRKLEAIVKHGKRLLYTDQKILDYLIEFVIRGPVLKRFNQWTDPIDPSFPSRHAVSHGRYEESLLTEEYSIKLFLLMDTMYHVLKY